MGYADPAAAEYKILVNMCAGRLSPQLLMHAFERDAWGVLVSGCPADECEHDGHPRARQTVKGLQETLANIGVDPSRIEYVEIPKGSPAKLEQAIADFMEQLHELGPLRP